MRITGITSVSIANGPRSLSSFRVIASGRTGSVPAETELVVVFCDKTRISGWINIQGNKRDTPVLHPGETFDLADLPAELNDTGWACIRYNQEQSRIFPQMTR